MHVTKVLFKTNHSFVHRSAVISEGCASVVQRQCLYGFHLWHRKGAITSACSGELQKKISEICAGTDRDRSVKQCVTTFVPGKVHVQDLHESLGSERVCKVCKV